MDTIINNRVNKICDTLSLATSFAKEAKIHYILSAVVHDGHNDGGQNSSCNVMFILVLLIVDSEMLKNRQAF